jgi:hypothetical protein
MLRRITFASFAAAAFVAVVAASPVAAAPKGGSGTCVNKAASGTNSTRDGAMFQAWEAVLQATDWGSWGTFMGSGAKIGTAPGYKVSNVRSRCNPGGLGYQCMMQATLCK